MAVVSKKIPAPDLVRIRTALLSVSDKTGIVEFARGLHERGVRLLSTGGTHKALAAEGLPVIDVSEITGFPEIMDGRVKTLHPKVHGGLLSIRDDAEHVEAMTAHGIEAIDLAVINLYPFEQVRQAGGDYPTTVENIDIGGPAMIRASAKNHAYVTVVTDAADYPAVIAALSENDGQTTYALRQKLAAKAYARTAAYDAAISNWFAEALEIEMPAYRVVGGALKEAMRYGENPHQAAGFYVTGDNRPGVASATLLQGKQLSYNNINDTDAAFELVAEFPAENGPACAIIKHANPCGVATGASLGEAYAKALAAAPTDRAGAFYFVEPDRNPHGYTGKAPNADASRHPPFDVNAIRRDFPILQERVNGRPLIWFDNAATTQKPRAVIDRLSDFYAHENSNIHRAAHDEGEIRNGTADR